MKYTLPLLIGSALLLASCNSTPTTPQAETVSGQVKELNVTDSGTVTYTGWTGGAGKVIALVEGNDNLVTANLAADGKFSLTLPTVDASLLTPVDFSAELPEGCTGDLKTSGASDARGTGASFRVQANKSGEIAPAAFQISASSISLQVGSYLYVDKAVGLSGKLTCTEEGASVSSDINVQLKAGWNKVTFTVTANDQGSGSVSLKTGSLPAQWVYLEGGASPLSLGQQSLKGAAQAQPALKMAEALKTSLFR